MVGDKNTNSNTAINAPDLDTFIPTIPKVNKSSIKDTFKTNSITPINREPTFENMQLAEQELACSVVRSYPRYTLVGETEDILASCIVIERKGQKRV